VPAVKGSTGGVLLGVAVLMLVQAAVVLGGLYLIGEELKSELDRQVQRATRDFESDLEQIRRDVRRELRRELDARLPPAP
jgi:glucose-6-phosphate-specific signal transduction histidine kinase